MQQNELKRRNLQTKGREIVPRAERIRNKRSLMNTVLLRSRIKADGGWYLVVQGDQLVQQDLVSKEKKQIALDVPGCILQNEERINRSLIRTETIKQCICLHK